MPGRAKPGPARSARKARRDRESPPRRGRCECAREMRRVTRSPARTTAVSAVSRAGCPWYLSSLLILRRLGRFDDQPDWGISLRHHVGIDLPLQRLVLAAADLRNVDDGMFKIHDRDQITSDISRVFAILERG